MTEDQLIKKRIRDAVYRDKNRVKIRAAQRKWRAANKGVISPKRAIYQKRYRQKLKETNPEKWRIQQEKKSLWLREHKEEQRGYVKKYLKAHPEKAKELAARGYRKVRGTEKFKERNRTYNHLRWKTNIQHKLGLNLRNRLNKALRNRGKASAVKNLGCSIPELVTHIESKFYVGMSWDNWSVLGWHIDHIKPLALFDLTDPKQLAEACHYTNLQPLWAKENLSKGMTYQHIHLAQGSGEM